MQAQMCALLSTTEGISVITENIFPQRYMHVAELKRMGAQMSILKGRPRSSKASSSFAARR